MATSDSESLRVCRENGLPRCCNNVMCNDIQVQSNNFEYSLNSSLGDVLNHVLYTSDHGIHSADDFSKNLTREHSIDSYLGSSSSNESQENVGIKNSQEFNFIPKSDFKDFDEFSTNNGCVNMRAMSDCSQSIPCFDGYSTLKNTDNYQNSCSVSCRSNSSTTLEGDLDFEYIHLKEKENHTVVDLSNNENNRNLRNQIHLAAVEKSGTPSECNSRASNFEELGTKSKDEFLNMEKEGSTHCTENIKESSEDEVACYEARNALFPFYEANGYDANSSHSIHVQFDTTFYDNDSMDAVNINLINNNSMNTKKPSIQRLDSGSPDPVEYSSFATLKKRLKRRLRYPSSSSTISSDSSSSTSSCSSAEYRGSEFERRAPDGGWGWVIVFASFMIHCIADGVTMSFGVLYVEFLSFFQESRSLTSWVGSLFMAIPLLAGPLASLLTDRYGCRFVTICGAVIASIGFFVSAFANSIVFLLFSVGIITGVGLAVCYVAAIVIVAFYFEKYRSFATGIAVAGSGIGTFVFAPLIQYLLDVFGWRGCMIILAGIFLNMAVCGTLMRDLKWTKKLREECSPTNTSSTSRHCLMSTDNNGAKQSIVTSPTIPSINELKQIVQSGEVMPFFPEHMKALHENRRSGSLVLLPTFLDHSLISEEFLPNLTTRENTYEVASLVYPNFLSHSGCKNRKRADLFPKGQAVQPKLDTVMSTPHILIHESSDILGESEASKEQLDAGKNIACGNLKANKESCQETNTSSKDSNIVVSRNTETGCSIVTKRNSRILTRPSVPRRISCMGVSGFAQTQPVAPLKDMRVPRQSMTFRGAMLNINRYRLRASSCPNIFRNSIITIAQPENQNDWSYLDDLGEMLTACVDLNHCMDMAYLLFSLSNFILYVFYDTVYMYLTDYALGVGISTEESANLISAIGVLNCIGMVFMGYIGDQNWCSPMLVYSISMVVCGISVIAMPFITDYWVLVTASAVFGLFISANYALTAVILVELISLEAFSKSYGLLLLIQGMANLIGPPIVGFMADATGDYVIPFVVSGTFIVICGLMLSLIKPAQMCQSRYSRSSSPDLSTPQRQSSINRKQNLPTPV